jgi:hypothetical protein
MRRVTVGVGHPVIGGYQAIAQASPNKTPLTKAKLLALQNLRFCIGLGYHELALRLLELRSYNDNDNDHELARGRDATFAYSSSARASKAEL